MSNRYMKHFFRNYLASQSEAPWVDEIRQKLDLIKGAIMVDLTALIANETKLVADVASLKAANVQAATDLKSAQDALAAALAANDPAATKAAQDQIDAVAQALADADATIAPPVSVADPAPAPADVPAPAPDAA